MVNFCACVGCLNRWPRNKEKSFFRLPSVIVHQGEQTRALSERRQREWLAAIKRQDVKPENLQYTRVCSDHFIAGKPSSLYDSTNPDWVPSQNLGYNDASSGEPSRYERARSRQTKRKELQEIESEAKRKRLDTSQTEESQGETGTAVQTDLHIVILMSLNLRLIG